MLSICVYVTYSPNISIRIIKLLTHFIIENDSFELHLEYLVDQNRFCNGLPRKTPIDSETRNMWETKSMAAAIYVSHVVDSIPLRL